MQLALLVTGQASVHQDGSTNSVSRALRGTWLTPVQTSIISIGEFDPGSERTLAACLTHASRARTEQS
jgi:hypothetical protein